MARRTHTKSTRKKISSSLMNRKLTTAHRKHISESLLGKEKSELTKQRMSMAKTNISLATRRKLSESKMGDKNPRWGKKSELLDVSTLDGHKEMIKNK